MYQNRDNYCAFFSNSERDNKENAYGSMKNNYTVGVFWYIDRLFISQLQQKAPDQLSLKTGKVDSEYSHFYVWDTLFFRFPRADFASFPRGRVIYDLVRKKYIVYCDRCIPNNEIKRFAKRNKLIPFLISRDEHYQCDKCLKKVK